MQPSGTALVSEQSGEAIVPNNRPASNDSFGKISQLTAGNSPAKKDSADSSNDSKMEITDAIKDLDREAASTGMPAHLQMVRGPKFHSRPVKLGTHAKFHPQPTYNGFNGASQHSAVKEAPKNGR